MDRLKYIEETISRKLGSLDSNVQVVTPDCQTSAEESADWLIGVLCQMYTEHGITKRRGPLVDDIRKGDCRVWFGTENNQPVASAAIVKQSDGSSEIGRAVSLRNGLGGLLMLMAARDHLSRSQEPLVAEVRVADDFKGVPSGKATQKICLEHIGVLPHAAVPAFNHGEPVRQETFLFSSSQSKKEAKPMALPEDSRAMSLLTSTAIALAGSRFMPDLKVSHERSLEQHSGWVIVGTEPFSIIVPDGSTTNLENTVKAAEQQAAFTLAPIETTPESAPAIIECLNKGFVPCGIDRNLGASGRPVLLMGKLRDGTMLAPISLLNGLLPKRETEAIKKIDLIARKNLR